MKIEQQDFKVLTLPIGASLDDLADALTELADEAPEGYRFASSWRAGDNLAIKFVR